MYPCFESAKEWSLYWEVAHRSRIASPCVDCTPDRKAKMLAEDRCINPRCQFRKDEDGYVEGYTPAMTLTEAKAARIAHKVRHFGPQIVCRFGREIRTIPIHAHNTKRELQSAIVGVYDSNATVDQIAADIEATA